MRIARYELQSVTLIVVVAVLLAGCSSLSRKTPGPDDLAALAEARMVLPALGSKNAKLMNFKGIGNIKVRQNGKIRIDERIAWIGSETVKLSIVVLISGLPAVKIANDGKWFYYYEARRAPLRGHHSASLHRQSTGAGYILILKKRWWGIVEKVFLAEDKAQVHQVEFFNRSGALIYRARFDEMQIINGYQVPSRLSISDGEGITIQLEIQQYLADVPVSPSMFVLNPPD